MPVYHTEPPELGCNRPKLFGGVPTVEKVLLQCWVVEWAVNPRDVSSAAEEADVGVCFGDVRGGSSVIGMQVGGWCRWLGEMCWCRS